MSSLGNVDTGGFSKSKNLVLSNQVVAPYFNLLGLSLSQLGKNEDAEKFLLDGINKFPNEINMNREKTKGKWEIT